MGENLTLAFKGRGVLKVHLQDSSTVRLIGNEAVWDETYEKYLHDSKMYRFMEFEVPQHLDGVIVVIGETVPLYRPRTETRLRARLSSCGQVISSVSHLAS